MYLFIYLFVNSFINLFIYLVIHSFIQSLRAFRRPKLGGLKLPGFQDIVRLAWRGAVEDMNY